MEDESDELKERTPLEIAERALALIASPTAIYLRWSTSYGLPIDAKHVSSSIAIRTLFSISPANVATVVASFPRRRRIPTGPGMLGMMRFANCFSRNCFTTTVNCPDLHEIEIRPKSQD
jgi:hypothetical protein